MSNIILSISTCSPYVYPVELLEASLTLDEKEIINVQKQYPLQGKWGHPSFIQELDEINFETIRLKIYYLSVVEYRVYSVEKNIHAKSLINNNNEKVLLVLGMAPNGGVALWVFNKEKSFLLDWMQGNSLNICFDTILREKSGQSLRDICKKYISGDPIVNDFLKTNGLPPRNLFDKYMQQFNYRYVPHFMHWDDDAEDWLPYEEGEHIPEFDYIEEALFDGTHDKLHDGGLLKYHSAGKPKKLAVKWHVKKAQYTAYFWMEEDIIADIFEKFYGAHPDTQADLELHVDYERNIFEFSFYRHGLRVPLYFSPDTYQLIVFKDGFERFRSENYDQPKGAWVW